jgi:hypothetical protein
VRKGLRKIAHILVVLFFALVGAAALWGSFVFLFRGIRATWPGDRESLYRGYFELAFGAAYLSAAYGLYRRNYRVRVFATVLSGLVLLGSLMSVVLFPGILSFSSLGLALFVFIWLLLPSVRAQFLEAEERTKTA